MGWKLDDNTRSGVHYLVLGVLVMAVLALGNTALDSLFTPIGPDGSFGHGYLIEDDGDRMIVAGTTRGERLIAGIMLSFIAAVVIACVVALVTRGMRTAAAGWAVIAGRVVFFINITYFIYAALYLPPREFIGMRDRMFIVWERDVIMNDLPWPREKKILLIPFAHVEEIRSDAHEASRGKVVHGIIVDHASERLEVGCSAETTPDDSAATIFAADRVAHLEQMMLQP